MTARETALLTLTACQKQGAWSEGYLKNAAREAELDRRDTALAARLCYGVLQNRLLLDHYIGSYSTVKPEKMEHNVLNALRLGAYQLLFLTRVPASAAVSESVELTRRHSRNPRAAGLVNGVLRSLTRNLDRLPPLDRSDPVAYLSVRYSHPVWLVKEFLARLRFDEAEALLAANNEQPPVTAQTNLCRVTSQALLETLTAQGVQAQAHPWLPGCLTLKGAGDLEALPAFREGLFYIQDAAARLCVTAAGLKPGMQVLDACAAPGGKSFAAAVDMRNQGKVSACDIHPHKKKLIEAGAERMGLTCLQAAVADARKTEFTQAYDAVIADVPCSGLGVIRKKPDIRYKDPAPLAGLPAVQREILESLSRAVKPEGVLLYATCTLLERENEEIVTAFLARHPEFAPESFELPGPVGRVEAGMLTLWPQVHDTDGFFMAKLRRKQ